MRLLTYSFEGLEMEDAEQRQGMQEAQDKAQAAREQVETEDTQAGRDDAIAEAERQESTEESLRNS